MRKLILLILTYISLIGTMSATTITFDFLNQTYGLPRETESSAPNLAAGTTISTQGLNLTFDFESGYGFRLWRDGLRVYPGKVSFTFSGYKTTALRLYNGNALLGEGHNTNQYYPWGVGWEIGERQTITRMEVDVMVMSDVTFDFVNNTYGLPRQSNTDDPYITAGTVIQNDGVSLTFDRTEGNGFRLWKDGLRVYKGACAIYISAPEVIESITVYYNKGLETSFSGGFSDGVINCSFAERGSIQKIILKFGQGSSAPVVMVSQITVSPSSVSGIPGESRQLSCSIYPSNATNKRIMWSSSNSSVATVDNNGLIQMVGTGSCIVTALAMDGSGVYGICTVSVDSPKATSIQLSPASYQGYAGESVKLIATVYPVNAATQTLSWISSNDNVASVDHNGTVRLKNVGECIIYAEATDGSNVRGTARIHVLAPLVSAILLDRSYYEGPVGTTFKLTPTIIPENAGNKKVNWRSTDINVAAVDQSGFVRMLNPGVCIILAEAVDGSNVSGACNVKVTTDGSVSEIEADSSVIIYSVDGLIKYSGFWNNNPLSELPSGIYIIHYNDKIIKVAK